MKTEDTHIPTLTKVLMELHNLRPAPFMKGNYARGFEEGIREAIRLVDSMRIKSMKES